MSERVSATAAPRGGGDKDSGRRLTIKTVRTGVADGIAGPGGFVRASTATPPAPRHVTVAGAAGLCEHGAEGARELRPGGGVRMGSREMEDNPANPSARPERQFVIRAGEAAGFARGAAWSGQAGVGVLGAYSDQDERPFR